MDTTFLTRGAAFALLLSPAGALAQQDTARVPLPAITVNVLRAGLPLHALPLAVTRLDAMRTLDAGAGISLDEALRGVPGVQLDNRHNQALGERLSIRGFGARAGFGIRGVHVLVDGIPATMADGQTTLNHVDPAQILAADVVRGPGAAFLGNAAGGALQLRTGAAAPGALELAAGAHGLRRASASVRSDHASAYASWQAQDGFRARNESERTVLGASGALDAGRGRLEAALHATRYDADNPGALTLEQLAADRTQAGPNNVRQRTGEAGTHAQLGAGWIVPLSAYRLEVRAHGGLRTLDNPIPPRIIDLDRVFGGARAQLVRTLASGTVALGAELEAQRDDRLNYVNEQGTRGDLVLDQQERVRALAAFAQAQWSPAPAVRLLGALRRDGVRFAVTDALLANGDDSGERELAATSFTLGAGVSPAEGVELFANAGSAFETPTTTELANRPDGTGGFNPGLEPERTRSWEAGLRVARRRATAELSLFRAEVRDKLIVYEAENVPGRQFYRNAGRARHQGLEAAASVSLARRLQLHASWTRLDARFRDYVVAGVDLAGKRIPGVAGHQLEAGLRAELSEATSFTAYYRWTGRVPVNDANDAHAPAYALLGARANAGVARLGGVRAGLYAGVDNLLGERYTAAVSVNAFGGRYYEPGPGRSAYAGVRLSLR